MPSFVSVDLAGPWHLRIQVADRDSGYVLANQDANELKALQFVIDSIPGERVSGTGRLDCQHCSESIRLWLLR